MTLTGPTSSIGTVAGLVGAMGNLGGIVSRKPPPSWPLPRRSVSFIPLDRSLTRPLLLSSPQFFALMFRYHTTKGYATAWLAAGGFAAGLNLLCAFLPTPKA
jgi:hypothetical protein